MSEQHPTHFRDVTGQVHAGSGHIINIYPASPQEARPPFTLPPDLLTFTGRDDLLDVLDGLLHPGGETTVSIVGLKGMAGVGKSALAIHAAHRWRDRFPDGIVWIDLRGESGACDGLRHVAALYGYQEQAARAGDDPRALAGLVRTILRDKRALLILDNAESLPAGELNCLLPGVPGPVTLVTSRRAFPALERLGRPLRVDVMDEEESLDLLGRLVGRERVEAERAGYLGLAERLGRLPLALDIGGRLMRDRGWGPAEMERRLEGAADRPAFLALPIAERVEDSVALAFALSYDGLDEEHRELFRALSPFAPAGFSPQAVAAVLERDDEGGVEGGLERLETLSLVRRAEAKDRYDLHPLLRDYGLALAVRAGERWAVRHARYFVGLADWGGRQLGNPETALQAVGMATVERANLLAAQQTSLAQGLWDEAVSLAYDLGRLFERSGHWADRRRALEAGIQAARKGEKRRDEAGLIHNLAVLAQAQGEYGEARRLYQEAADTFEQLGAQREQAAVLHELGRLAQDQGEYGEARRLYQESLEIKQQLGDRAGVAYTLGQLGNLAYAQGNLDEARQLYEQVRDVSGQMGDRKSVATALHQLGMLAQDQGEYGEARRLYQESLEIKQQLGNRAGVAQTLHQLGMLAQGQGEYGEPAVCTGSRWRSSSNWATALASPARSTNWGGWPKRAAIWRKQGGCSPKVWSRWRRSVHRMPPSPAVR